MSTSGCRVPPILAVSGVKNAGKTTLLEGLLPALGRLGLSAAAIKRHGHPFRPDGPETDTHRLRRAGAVGTVLAAPGVWTAVREEEPDPQAMAALFPRADLVLLEGGKDTPLPKLLLTRGWGDRPVAHPESVLALVSEGGPLPLAGPPVYSPGDLEGLAALAARWLEEVGRDG